MKTHQTAFNGSGAQEATDQIFLAHIHPLMPARLVCLNNTLFQRLLDVVIAYDYSRNNLALRGALPYVSGDSPFHMNTSGHDKYLRQVFCFKRQVVKLDADQLRCAHELNLFQPNAVIQPDGRALGVSICLRSCYVCANNSLFQSPRTSHLRRYLHLSNSVKEAAPRKQLRYRIYTLLSAARAT
jgi:hypothetical protein